MRPTLEQIVGGDPVKSLGHQGRLNPAMDCSILSRREGSTSVVTPPKTGTQGAMEEGRERHFRRDERGNDMKWTLGLTAALLMSAAGAHADSAERIGLYNSGSVSGFQFMAVKIDGYNANIGALVEAELDELGNQTHGTSLFYSSSVTIQNYVAAVVRRTNGDFVGSLVGHDAAPHGGASVGVLVDAFGAISILQWSELASTEKECYTSASPRPCITLSRSQAGRIDYQFTME